MVNNGSQIVKNKEHVIPTLKECQHLELEILMRCEVGLQLSYPIFALQFCLSFANNSKGF